MLVEEIDETNFEEKNKEGQERVTKKIKQIDAQIQKNNINWYLFFDPTVWAYKILKDKQNKPLILRGFQDKIINDNHSLVVVAAANQIGKTWSLGCVKAIHHALHVNNASVLIISRSEQQAIMILDEIKWMMKRASIPFETVIGQVENRTELHLINNDKVGVSVIRCLPPTSSVLAYPATLIICDEIGFWEIDGLSQYEFFLKCVVSRTYATRSWKNDKFTMGQIVCISNPNGQQGALWELWNDKDGNQYRYSYLANPDNNLEDYNKAKEKYPGDIFESTMAAVFTSATGGFITKEEWDAAVQKYDLITPGRFFLGGDFAGEDTKGRDVDSSDLVGAENIKEENKEKVRVCYLKEFPLRTKKETIYHEINLFKEQIVKFAYDKVGVGDSVKNDLKERGIFSEHQIEALTYSLPNKSEVYYNLKHLFEQRKIIVPNNEKLRNQLLGLRFEKTEGGYIKIHHKSEGLHDDLADALANACYAARVLRGSEPYIGMTKRVYSSEQVIQGALTLICPECEKIDYKGQSGYYRGKSPNGLSLERINCPRHQITI